MQTNETQTQAGKRPPAKVTAKVASLPVWRPQPSGLTRAELRRIVLETLG